ncbi:hypothetical protein B0J17DRAFT_706389 [Rhizoctonia solani]|nr:hypothetical protein B0J17DRAFT_706389 [Rhizoctonia solani]
MTKVSTPRQNVEVGQLIWARMGIPPDLVKEGVLNSKTANDIASGKPVLKQARVVEVNPDYLVVRYRTTFGRKSLDKVVKDPDDWEPDPGGEGWLWKGAIEVYEDPVEMLPDKTSPSSIPQERTNKETSQPINEVSSDVPQVENAKEGGHSQDDANKGAEPLLTHRIQLQIIPRRHTVLALHDNATPVMSASLFFNRLLIDHVPEKHTIVYSIRAHASGN